MTDAIRNDTDANLSSLKRHHIDFLDGPRLLGAPHAIAARDPIMPVIGHVLLIEDRVAAVAVGQTVQSDHVCFSDSDGTAMRPTESMDRAPTEAVQPSRDWLIRPFERSGLAPAWVGLAIAMGWVLFVGLVHAAAHVIVGPAAVPVGPGLFVWTVVVNAVLMGLIPAALAHLYRGAVSDLHTLRPLLPGGAAEFARLSRSFPSLSTSTRALVTALGVAGGVAVATLDPVLRDINSHLGPSDPRYLVFILQNVLFGVLGTRLFATEVHLTRAYARLGEQVEVDLLDQSNLLVFARKGLRSVVVWVLVSSAFSMFWVLDSAGQANIAFPIGVLVLVTVALVAPTRGIHLSIVSAKATELARVTEAIRSERATALAPTRADAPVEDARLGNLVQYYAFVKSIREWPFDLSIVARSLLLIVLGAGSWIGGAVVERLLGLALD